MNNQNKLAINKRFKIITSNFKNYFERIHNEAHFIKTKRPSLNVKSDKNFFELYSKMGSFKKI